jgi:hypothetical protein
MIETYCRTFFGYGHWGAPIWLVGLEEAGDGRFSTLEFRVQQWHQRGCRELEDAPTFYPACGLAQWHGPAAQLQHTWSRLLRIIFRARGESVTEESVTESRLLAAQANWGSITGDICLAELSPIPTKSRSTWLQPVSQLPAELATRADFQQTILPWRLATLRERICQHRPKAVLFYFWKPRHAAEAIAGCKFQPILPEELLGAERAGTRYFITGHPAGGYPDKYFDRLGDYLRTHQSHLFSDAERRASDPSKSTPRA